MKRLLATITAAIAMSVVLVGCGSDEGTPADDPTTAGSTAPSASGTPTPTSTPDGEASPGGEASGHVIAADELESQIEKQIADNTGETVAAACGDDLTGPVGNSVPCALATDNGTRQVEAVVTQVLEDGLVYDLKTAE